MADNELREQRRKDTHNALDDILACQQILIVLASKLNALNTPDDSEQWSFSEITDFKNSLTEMTARLFSVKAFLENEYFREVDGVVPWYSLPETVRSKPKDDPIEREKEILSIARNSSARLHEIILALLVRLGPDRARNVGWRINKKHFSNITNALTEDSMALATFFNNLKE